MEGTVFAVEEPRPHDNAEVAGVLVVQLIVIEVCVTVDEEVKTVGGDVLIVHEKVAPGDSVFPTLSTEYTLNVWDPSANPDLATGLVHTEGALPSQLQYEVEV